MLALCVFAILVWLANPTDAWTLQHGFTGQQQDYYNLLVDGMLEGKLSLDVEVTFAPSDDAPPPRLPEPYLLDANFHDGRYYLYYGVVPAVALMLPYSWLTGHDLSTGVVVLMFIALGYTAALGAYHRLRNQFFPELPLLAHALFVVCLGVGAIQPYLAVRGAFYEVPASGVYAFTMLAAWFAVAIFTGTRRPLAALAAASLAMGLAVGCRPVALFSLPALLVPAWWIHRARLAGILRLGGVLLPPAASVGVALAIYNHARFGSPLEFGFRYGLNSFFASGDPLYSLKFIGPNLTWYYLSLPSLSPFFPFVFPVASSFPPEGYHGVEAVQGQLWLTSALGLSVVSSAVSRTVRAHLAEMRSWLLTIAIFVFPPLAFLLCLTMRGTRYLADFQPMLVLGLVSILGVMFVTRAGLLLRLARRLAGTVVGLGMVVSLFGAIQQFDQFRNTRPETFERLATIGDKPASLATRLGLLRYGLVAFDVTFPEVEGEARMEPLLALGLPGYSDSLNVSMYPSNQIELMLDHSNYGGPRSRLIAIEPRKTYRITVRMGALLPPLNDDFFDAAPEDKRNYLKRKAVVTFDGEAVIDRTLGYYEAPPWTLQLGRNLITRSPGSTTFSGTVTNIQRLWLDQENGVGVEEFLADAASKRVGWFLELDPPPIGETFFPVLAAGETGAGNLLGVRRPESDHLVFQLDSWGIGLAKSPPISLSLGAPLKLEVFVSSAVAFHDLPDAWGIELPEPAPPVLQIWHEGQCVWQTPILGHAGSFDATTIGLNDKGFTTATVDYAGKISEFDPGDEEKAAFLGRALKLPPP